MLWVLTSEHARLDVFSSAAYGHSSSNGFQSVPCTLFSELVRAIFWKYWGSNPNITMIRKFPRVQLHHLNGHVLSESPTAPQSFWHILPTVLLAHSKPQHLTQGMHGIHWMVQPLPACYCELAVPRASPQKEAGIGKCIMYQSQWQLYLLQQD